MILMDFSSIQIHTVRGASYTGAGKNNPIRLDVYFTSNCACSLLFKIAKNVLNVSDKSSGLQHLFDGKYSEN